MFSHYGSIRTLYPCHPVRRTERGVFSLSKIYLVLDSDIEKCVNALGQEDYCLGDMSFRLKPNQRNGIIDEKYRWENGLVPYVFNSSYSEYTRTKNKSQLEMT